MEFTELDLAPVFTPGHGYAFGFTFTGPNESSNDEWLVHQSHWSRGPRVLWGFGSAPSGSGHLVFGSTAGAPSPVRQETADGNWHHLVIGLQSPTELFYHLDGGNKQEVGIPAIVTPNLTFRFGKGSSYTTDVTFDHLVGFASQPDQFVVNTLYANAQLP